MHHGVGGTGGGSIEEVGPASVMARPYFYDGRCAPACPNRKGAGSEHLCYVVYIDLHLVISMSTTMTIRLEDDTKDRLDKLAAATQRSRSFLAAEAVREYVALNEWQVSEIQSAVSEAERGDFASDADVTTFFQGWRGRADGTN